MHLTHEIYKNLIDNSPVGLIVVSGPEHLILIANRSGTGLIMRQPGQITGRPFFDVLPEDAVQFKPIIEKVRMTGRREELPQYTFQRSAGGSSVNSVLQISFEPYEGLDGTITGVVIRLQDITDQIRSREMLERAFDQVSLSKEAAQLGLFDFDIENDLLEWDSRCRALFGINHNGPVNYERDFVRGLHPDDRERITGIIDQLFDRRISNGEYDVEYRTIGAEDQRRRWVRAKGKVYFDEKDKPLRFIGSVLDITERKELELKKNDFIGMVSHELKTPLTSLSGYIQSMLMKTGRDEDALLHEHLTKAQAQTRKMSRMINGFLDLSRLESGKMVLDRKLFDLPLLIGETTDDLAASLPKLNCRLHLAGSLQVNADRDKIGSVLVNLISNAVKYSERGSEIAITCDQQEQQALISVNDHGIGIPPEDIPFIFDRFYRVETHQLRHVSGFGVGLYLCAEIIRYHSGRLWVESIPGEGSTFYFSIPVKGL